MEGEGGREGGTEGGEGGREGGREEEGVNNDERSGKERMERWRRKGSKK